MTEKLKADTFLKTICIDFDGVLHTYDTKWSGAATISDGPVPGAMEFLHLLAGDGDFKTAIYSSRSKDPAGLRAMQVWLRAHLVKAFGQEEGDRIMVWLSFPIEKPAAWITIDDRCFLFEGAFPTLAFLRAFKPWNKKRDTLEPSGTIQQSLASWDLRSLLETAWDLGAGTAYARRDRPAEYEADGKRDVEIRAADVGRVLEKVGGAIDVPERALRYAAAKASRLDSEFAPYADIEAIIAAVLPPGTQLSRAIAGGERGWRVGWGWLSVEGARSTSPDVLRDTVRRLAAIPDIAGLKPQGDPEFVRRALAAGRAM